MKHIRLIRRDKLGRFAKANPRRVLTLEVREIVKDKSVLLSSQRGRFSEKKAQQIKHTSVRRVEAEKVETILEERPYVPRAERIERQADGIFKVTIRSTKTRTILHIRKSGSRWQTIRKSSVRL